MGQLSCIRTSDEVFPYMRGWVGIYPLNAKEKVNVDYTGHNADCLLYRTFSKLSRTYLTQTRGKQRTSGVTPTCLFELKQIRSTKDAHMTIF